MKTKTKKDGAKKATKYKKAPDAPKRFKSAFIIFSAQKHKSIKKDLLGEGRTLRTTEIAKMVSGAWKGLDPDERKVWEEKADKDKARYEAEKIMYKGPWKIPSNKRKSKDPAAPKRPMSAFLAYSNSRRADLKRQHPKSTNADLSRMLSKTWKELDPQERAVYMADERKLREKYKTDMAEFRQKAAAQKKIERDERESAAMQAAEAGPQPGMDPDRSEGPSSGVIDNKWMSMQQQQQDDQQQQQDQQQQLSDMANAGMFSNPYLQAAAFGGGGAGQAAALGLNPAAASNPYFANAFAGQGYMQGMQGGGNPALSLFGAQAYMQNGGMPAGMPGQLQGGLYGPNFGMPGMNDGSAAAAAGGAGYSQMQP